MCRKEEEVSRQGVGLCRSMQLSTPAANVAAQQCQLSSGRWAQPAASVKLVWAGEAQAQRDSTAVGIQALHRCHLCYRRPQRRQAVSRQLLQASNRAGMRVWVWQGELRQVRPTCS